MRIFISYSKKDRKYAQILQESLSKRGFEVWIDFNILKEIEININQRIDKGLLKADILLYLLSLNSYESPWVLREIDTWFKKLEKEGKRKIDGKSSESINKQKFFILKIKDLLCKDPPISIFFEPILISTPPNKSEIDSLIEKINSPSDRINYPDIRETAQEWLSNRMPQGAIRIYEQFWRHDELNKQSFLNECNIDNEASTMTPLNFYSFKEEAAWLGIYKSWDVQREVQKKIYNRVTKALEEKHNRCPVIAIKGGELTGKSVIMSRLAVDLARNNFEEQTENLIWWLEDTESFIHNDGIKHLIKFGNGIHFIFIDEFEKLSNKDGEKLYNELNKNDSLYLIIAGKEIQKKFLNNLRKEDYGLIDLQPKLETYEDFNIFVKTISEQIPKWKKCLNQLNYNKFKEINWLLALLILARRNKIPSENEDYRSEFNKIIRSDLENIRKRHEGLYRGVIISAYICNIVGFVSCDSIKKLTDAYKSKSEPSYKKLEQGFLIQSPLDILAPIFSYNPKHNTCNFHNRYIAQLITEEFLSNWGDSGGVFPELETNNDMIEIIINNTSEETKSYFVRYGFKNHHEGFSKETTIKLINKLIKSNNSHHSHLTLIFDPDLEVTNEIRLGLLEKIVKLQPNSALWAYVNRWIKQFKTNNQLSIIEKLFRQGCRVEHIVNLYLALLPETEKKKIAKELIASDNIAIKANCMDILKEDISIYSLAREIINKGLNGEFVPSNILCKSMDIVKYHSSNTEVKDLLQFTYKIFKINNSFEVQCKALELLVHSEKLLKNYKNMQIDILLDKKIEDINNECIVLIDKYLDDKYVHPHVVNNCLNYLDKFKQEIFINKCIEIVKDPLADDKVYEPCIKVILACIKDLLSCKKLTEKDIEDIIAVSLNKIKKFLDNLIPANTTLLSQHIQFCFNILNKLKRNNYLLGENQKKTTHMAKRLLTQAIQNVNSKEETNTRSKSKPLYQSSCDMICATMNYLGKEANKEAANFIIDFLNGKNIFPNLIECSLNVLNDPYYYLMVIKERGKIFNFAQKTQNQKYEDIIYMCLKYDKNSSSAIKTFNELLKKWDMILNPRLKEIALCYGNDLILKNKRAHQVLKSVEESRYKFLVKSAEEVLKFK